MSEIIDKDDLIAKCAEIAANSKDITAYVLLWEKDGILNYCRNGGLHSQLGMTQFMLEDIKHAVKRAVKE